MGVWLRPFFRYHIMNNNREQLHCVSGFTLDQKLFIALGKENHMPVADIQIEFNKNCTVVIIIILC